MKKWFRYKGPPQLPLNRSGFRIRFLKEILFLIVLLAIAYAIFQIGNHYSSFAIQITAICVLIGGCLIYSANTADMFSCRFLDIYPKEKEFNSMIFALFSAIPITNVPLLLIALCKKRTESYAPLFLKKLWIPVAIYFFFCISQGVLFGFNLLPRQAITVSSWLNAPSQYYIHTVIADAVWAFEFKKTIHRDSVDPKAKIIKAYADRSFDSTGVILTTAVLATDAYKKREIASDKDASKIEAMLKVIEYSIFLIKMNEESPNFILKFNPVSILSAENIIEIGLLSMIESEIVQKFQWAIWEKLDDMIANLNKKIDPENVLHKIYLNRVNSINEEFKTMKRPESGRNMQIRTLYVGKDKYKVHWSQLQKSFFKYFDDL